MITDSILLAANLVLAAILLKPAAEELGRKLSHFIENQEQSDADDDFVPPHITSTSISRYIFPCFGYHVYSDRWRG